jgi:hypothetical protein
MELLSEIGFSQESGDLAVTQPTVWIFRPPYVCGGELLKKGKQKGKGKRRKKKKGRITKGKEEKRKANGKTERRRTK